MIECLSGTTNSIIYIPRYNKIDYYTIENHDTKQIYSGITEIYAYTNNGRIEHNLDFNFEQNVLYTYKSYFKYQDVNYLCYQSLIKVWSDGRMNNYVNDTNSDDNYFITYKD